MYGFWFEYGPYVILPLSTFVGETVVWDSSFPFGNTIMVVSCVSE